MNQQLIKLIELCLIDGVISDKERSVIFKKSEELGISKDECEIILEGMIQKHSKKNTSQPQKKKGCFGSIMDEVKKGVDEVKKNIDVDSITDKVKSIQEEYEKKVKEVTNQNQPKTTSSSKTSKPKSTTPKKVSKPKPTSSKPKKTNRSKNIQYRIDEKTNTLFCYKSDKLKHFIIKETDFIGESKNLNPFSHIKEFGFNGIPNDVWDKLSDTCIIFEVNEDGVFLWKSL